MAIETGDINDARPTQDSVRAIYQNNKSAFDNLFTLRNAVKSDDISARMQLNSQYLSLVMYSHLTQAQIDQVLALLAEGVVNAEQ